MIKLVIKMTALLGGGLPTVFLRHFPRHFLAHNERCHELSGRPSVSVSLYFAHIREIYAKIGCVCVCVSVWVKQRGAIRDDAGPQRGTWPIHLAIYLSTYYIIYCMYMYVVPSRAVPCGVPRAPCPVCRQVYFSIRLQPYSLLYRRLGIWRWPRRRSPSHKKNNTRGSRGMTRARKIPKLIWP